MKDSSSQSKRIHLHIVLNTILEERFLCTTIQAELREKKHQGRTNIQHPTLCYGKKAPRQRTESPGLKHDL